MEPVPRDDACEEVDYEHAWVRGRPVPQHGVGMGRSALGTGYLRRAV